MSLTKVFTLSEYLKIPQWNCKRSLIDLNIIDCNYKDEEFQYYMFSEKYDLYKATYRKLEKDAWRFPLDFILKYTTDSHHGFNGIKNEKIISNLMSLQANLREDFNELIFAIIQNKTKFIESIVEEFGYIYIWKPIDGIEIKENGFRGYRIK